MRNFLIYIFTVLYLMSIHNVSFAVEDDIKEKILQCLRGMDDNIMRLNSGICHIAGKSVIGDKSVTESIKIAFDYQKGMYRFDRPECYSLKTPEFYFEFQIADKMGSAVIRQKTSERKPSRRAAPFDIQSLTMLSLVGPYWNITYQQYREKLLYEDVLVSYKQLSENLIFIETNRIFTNNNRRTILSRNYWLSPKQGYSMIKGEFAKIDTVELSWKEKNETWVPVAFKLSSVQDYSAEWKIDWELVNEPVPDKYFDPNLLSKESVPLYSEELNDSIQIGRIGGGGKSPKPIKPKSMDYDYIFKVSLITGGVILAIIAFCKMLYDRWKQKKQA